MSAQVAPPDPPRSVVPRVFGVISVLLALLPIALLALPALDGDVSYRIGRVFVQQVSGPRGKSYFVEVEGRRLQADAKRARSVLFIGNLTVTLFGALSLLLLAAGVGQLRYAAWGRTLALTWAFLSLCFVLLVLFMLLPEFTLRMRELVEHALHGRFHAAAALTSYAPKTVALPALLLVIYPMATLFSFVLPHTKASMR